NWLQVADTGPQIVAAALAYDPARQRVVAAHSNQTWEWDGGAWTQVADWGGGDRPRLAYDTARARTVSVAWGGQTLTTWEWDGTAWQQVQDMGASPRGYAAMAYDPDRHQVVLFGGLDNELSRPELGDTWELGEYA